MLKYPIAYWPVHALLYGLIKILPYKSSQYIGKKLGDLAHCTLKKRRLITFNNIKKCYPKKTKSEQEHLTKEHFQALGQGIIELLMAWFYKRKTLKKHTKVSGLSHIDPNHGAILLSGHFTHVEIASRIIGLHLNNKEKTAVLYIPTKNKLTEKLICNHRKDYIKPIPFDKPLAAIKHLKQKKWLFILPDQNLNHKKRGASISFFNQKLKALTSCSEIAQITKSKIYPCFCHKTNNTYHISIEPAFKHIPSKDITKDTQQIFDKIAEHIKKNPANYLWIHQLFKKK